MSRFHARRLARDAVVIAVVLTAVPTHHVRSQATQTAEPLRRTLTYQGAEREYFLHRPRRFDPGKTYWPLVAVHGGGGNGRGQFTDGMAQSVGESDLEAIVIAPSFSNDDFNASRFPSLVRGRSSTRC